MWRAWSLGQRSPAITFDDRESRAAGEMNIPSRKTVGEEREYWLDNCERAALHSTLMGNNTSPKPNS